MQTKVLLALVLSVAVAQGAVLERRQSTPCSPSCSGASPCCSQYGYCGSTSAYCGTGCQISFSAAGACTGSGTPPPAPTTSHRLVGYWQNWATNGVVRRLSDASLNNYDIVMVAFATTASTGSNSFTPAYTGSTFSADVGNLKAKGKKVLLSVGGANGVHMFNMNANTFATTACSLMKTWGFQGIDIDFEVSKSYSEPQTQFQPSVMASAINQLKAMTTCGLPSGTKPIITLTPQTLDLQPLVWATQKKGVYLQLLEQPNVKANIDWVQTQYYNSGSMNGYNQGTVDFITSQAYYLLNTVALKPAQVALGFPASSSAAGSGYVSSTIANSAFTCLSKGTGCGTFKPAVRYSVLGPMLWSINLDTSNTYSTALRNNFANY